MKKISLSLFVKSRENNAQITYFQADAKANIDDRVIGYHSLVASQCGMIGRLPYNTNQTGD